ncbi:hypothetical protein IX318_000880 [Porphyromonas levii]|nr:hypothetical protein [Porphyromonas levii]MBR8727511.1 hypothetical protein [Porphyromonas levii]MBR8735846.1 hypothetical protein [Porphyromonas levii]MBR8777918.1 hypothetical protein [Porphyromonas levii]MBR8782715.1 hypothetical protein [Porphyromonas levii]
MAIAGIGLVDNISDHTPEREVVFGLYLYLGVLVIGRHEV